MNGVYSFVREVAGNGKVRRIGGHVIDYPQSESVIFRGLMRNRRILGCGNLMTCPVIANQTHHLCGASQPAGQI